MRTLITAAVLLCAFPPGAAACLGSAREVWQQHPRTHATWNYVDGQRCWRAGHPHHRAHMRAHIAVYAMATMPLPRARPDPEITDPERYQRASIEEGRALARFLLPPPNFAERWP